MGAKWSFSYEVAKPQEFVVLTGVGIKTVLIRKAALKKPGQVSNRMDITPQNYEFAIQAMSAEKLVFQLPGVMTIGPNVEVGGSMEEGSENYINMQRFATFFGDSPIDIQIKTIKGMIEGEMRGACASMTLEEIFKDRTLFKKRVTDAIQQELDQFGLKIKSSNIRELEDTQGSEYFSYLRQKTRSGAENDAKIAIADANNRGTVGQVDREANTRVNTAMINARAIVAENEQRTKVLESNTSLQLNMIQYETKIKLRQTEQAQEVIKTELEQSRVVEEVRQGKRLEELRAKQGVDAAIEAEIVQKNADANYYANVKLADAKLYEKQKEAEGIKVLADSRKKALAQYTEVLKEPNTLLNYIMMERGLFQQMAEINSDAIQGLNPQITVWNTGANGESHTTDPYAPIRNVFSAMPPLYATVQAQTGVSAPAKK